MLKLNFNLRHQAITLSNPGTIVATDSKNYLVANFNFISDDWEYPLTAVFTSDVEKIPYTILVGQSEELEENECLIPWEVLQSSGNVYVSVFCGDLHTTNTVKFKVVKSGYTEGEIPPSPTPTIYEQILQALDSKQPMLTAGENITISDNNVISAEGGGVTSYNDLTDKPKLYLTVGGADPSIAPTEVDISNVFKFLHNEVYLTHPDKDGKHTVIFNIPIDELKKSQNFFYAYTEWYKYDFNNLITHSKNGLWLIGKDKCKNTPQFIDEYFGNRHFFLMHFYDSYNTFRVIVGYDSNNKLRIVSQYIQTDYETGVVTSQTDWAELTGGGSQYTLTEQDKEDIANIVIQKMQGSD